MITEALDWIETLYVKLNAKSVIMGVVTLETSLAVGTPSRAALHGMDMANLFIPDFDKTELSVEVRFHVVMQDGYEMKLQVAPKTIRDDPKKIMQAIVLAFQQQSQQRSSDPFAIPKSVL